MQYEFTRNELAEAFCARFVNQMAMAQAYTGASNMAPTTACMRVLWPAFLDACADLDLIDRDAAEEWAAAPPTGRWFDELSRNYG